MRKTGLIWLLAGAGCVFGQPAPKPVPAPEPPPRIATFKSIQSEDSSYDRAARMLQKRDYQGALKEYNALVQRAGTRAEGASYWQAYSLFKLGQATEAMNTLTELAKKYPNSRWLNDAKALEMEIRQSQGQNISPDQQSDEELKLMALASLMSHDSSQAVPTLRKVIDGGSSVRVKEQALFVLAQSRSPEARQVLADFAKGKGNPDLQMAAISMFGMQGGSETAPVLVEVYRANNDVAIRRRVLQSLGMTGSGEQLISIVRMETDASLRAEAIRMLGMGKSNVLTPDVARSIYMAESNRAGKEAMLDALAMRKDGKTLAEIFRMEKDMGLKQSALRRLQMADPKTAQDVMVSILEK
ncbi:MAG: HEAT repeat domain-containing protein [Bryobacteraceae bacterium]|nr:HEAT repeat domain-containing protein [Bryobacteraceae bacterium]